MADDTSRPILVVHLGRSDQRRIQSVLKSRGLMCTDEQAKQLAGIAAPLPQDDLSLVKKLSKWVQVDWDLAPEMIDKKLKELAAKWKNAANGPRKAIEIEMRMATASLEQHPDWWDHACWCASCRSN